MQRKLLVKSAVGRQTILGNDLLVEDAKLVEPFLDYRALRTLYAANVYHQRSLKLKAMLLSHIEESTLDRHLPEGITPKKFLYKFMLFAETYGSAFFERSVTVGDRFKIYNLDSFYARVDKNGAIYQYTGDATVALEGAHFMYDTILSEFYGEPDYIAALNQIVTLYKADRYNDAFFENGAKPDQAVIFEDSDPTEEQLDAIEEFYATALRGYKNAHKTLILTTGEGNGETKPKIRIEDIGKVEDLSFEKLKKIGRDEIIAAHGVPPRLVGVVDPNALGGGGELIGQLHMFNEIHIKPKMAMVEGFFAAHGVPLKLKEFDVTAFKDDADVVTALVGAGILTPAEAKAVIGWSK